MANEVRINDSTLSVEDESYDVSPNQFSSGVWDKRFVQFCGSINFIEYSHNDLPRLLQELEDRLKSLSIVENYYLIAHYETNTPHIHYAIELTGQKRKKTMLNDFVRLGYNREAVNCFPMGHLNAQVRYFLHQDTKSIELGKKRYEIDDLVSSMCYEYLIDLVQLEEDKMNVEKLISICLESGGNKISIMKRIGLEKYHKWRFEINEILNYDYHLRLARDKERERRKTDDLPF